MLLIRSRKTLNIIEQLNKTSSIGQQKKRATQAKTQRSASKVKRTKLIKTEDLLNVTGKKLMGLASPRK
jgi:hypothetical protein